MFTTKTTRIREHVLNVSADAPDFRDWQYQPALVELAPSVSKPRGLHILDQRGAGACTGYALAAVINILRRRAGRTGRVSERMLYETAKRHDEWRGYQYAGSSCRGAIKGWHNMGVCSDQLWSFGAAESDHLTVAAAKDARRNTLGAYYRLGTRLSDFHAALNEAGVIYCSADVHKGWDTPAPKTGVIPIQKETIGGHAFAIIGYNKKGFWIQNSWGKDWGNSGTALWLYEDWQLNISDAWVLHLALETPQVWHLPREGGSQAARVEGLFRDSPTRGEIAGHFVHIDDGDYHDRGRYWSNPDDVRQTADLVARSDNYDHLLLYAHGGLNSSKASARRIAAMKETFKRNRIYPYHFMYDTGLLEEIKDVIAGKNKRVLERVRNLGGWTNKVLEKVTHMSGRAIWRQMKIGSQVAFMQGGAGLDVLQAFITAHQELNKNFSLHLAGHSTGAIFHAYLVEALADAYPTMRIGSVGLLAPAATNELFKSNYRPYLKSPTAAAGIDRMAIFNLSEKLESEDSVAALYRDSLLQLVSRSYEEDPRPRKLLGLQEHNRGLTTHLPSLEIHYSDGGVSKNARTSSDSHAGFDNDVTTMNSVLRHILKRKPKYPFSAQTLKY